MVSGRKFDPPAALPPIGQGALDSWTQLRGGAIVRVLSQLRGLRLRFTLCRLRTTGDCGAFLHRMRRIDDPCLLVDLAADSTAYALYVGPRRIEAATSEQLVAAADRAVESLIGARLSQVLAEGAAPLPLERIEIAVLHAWADSLGLGAWLFGELDRISMRPLARPRQPIV